MRSNQTTRFRFFSAVVFRLALAFVACAVGTLAVPGGATAQDNPHGDLSLECSACHSTAGWTPLRDPLEFDHAEVGLALEQGHANLECVSCHQTLVFGFVPTACVDCHDDPHRGELGFDCEVCHSPTSWDNRRTIHDFHSATLFPLTGTHAAVDCAGCHRREPPFEYALTPTDCLSCHIEDYQNTQEPDHVAAGFPTDCQLCHGTVEWEGADFGGGFGFDHSTLFQLTGRHAQLDCSDCHVDGYAGTPSNCVGCHRADYNGTQDPNHQQAGFGTNCEDCHGTTTWEGAVIDHQSVFALTGSHRALDCSDCHSDGVFQGTPRDCVGCHRADFNDTRDPNHQSAGFGTDCEDCHDTSSWMGASVNHQQFWPLTGQHRNLDCEECHSDGFAGTPTDCNACHSADYDNTDDPDHRASGFSRDCEDCHTTSGWGGANFNHAFPIYSGNHRQGQAWDECSDCHPNAGNFGVFDCTACHSRGEMDDEHDDVGGYVYDSIECLACHPDGEED